MNLVDIHNVLCFHKAIFYEKAKIQRRHKKHNISSTLCIYSVAIQVCVDRGS